MWKLFSSIGVIIKVYEHKEQITFTLCLGSVFILHLPGPISNQMCVDLPLLLQLNASPNFLPNWQVLYDSSLSRENENTQ